MGNINMKYLHWIHTGLLLVAALLVFAIGLTPENTGFVDAAASAVMLLILIWAGLELYIRVRVSILRRAEEVELSLLRQIRFQLKDGIDISSEQVQASIDAANLSDKEYRNFNGFERPPVGIAASSFPRNKEVNYDREKQHEGQDDYYCSIQSWSSCLGCQIRVA